MVGFAAGETADDGDFVGDLGHVSEGFAEGDAWEGGFDDAEGAAVFERSFGFRVPAFLSGHAAAEGDVDDAFGFAFAALEVFLVGASGEAEEVCEGETGGGESADLEEAAALEKASVAVAVAGGERVHGRNEDSPYIKGGSESVRDVITEGEA